MAKFYKTTLFRRLSMLIVIAIIAAGVIAILHVHNVHKAQHRSGAVPTSKKLGSDKSSSAAKTNASIAQTPSSTTSGDKTTNATASPSAPLIAPFGSFVSNHQPGQNGSPTTEQSVCNTTPGASCEIQFTNSNGVVKTLGAQTTDSNGSAYWAWNVNGATLASGNWKITALAKLNGQTQTTSDPTPLEVQ